MPYKLTAYRSKDGFEIAGNREGLRHLAETCLALSELSEDEAEAKRLGNHHHFAEYMNNLEPGSTPFIVLYKPSL